MPATHGSCMDQAAGIGPAWAAFCSAAGMPATGTRDPFEVLDDLMQVVEALCPTWQDSGFSVSPPGFRSAAGSDHP